MTVPDGSHKFTDMRELGHFTHTQWNLEPYFLTKNGSRFQIYYLWALKWYFLKIRSQKEYFPAEENWIQEISLELLYLLSILHRVAGDVQMTWARE